jgi:hypothetical protein
MAYHFAESEFLSRRAIAATTIIALHVLVAYLLATGLMRTLVALPGPPMVGVVIDPVKRPPPPPLSVIEPNRLNPLIEPIIPPLVNRDDLTESARTITERPAPEQIPGGAAVDPIRVIGKHRLPDTERITTPLTCDVWAFKVPRPYGYASMRAVPGGVTRQSRNHPVTSGSTWAPLTLHVMGVMRDPYAATGPWRIAIGSASSSR